MYPDKLVEIEMGNQHATGFADITVASIASIISKDRLEKFDPSRFKLVLVDEAHHIVAKSYLKTLEHFNLHEKQDSSPALVGVSATLTRPDGLALGKALDHIVYHRDFVDMIKDKHLSSLVFTTVQSNADISSVRVQGRSGDFMTGELSLAVNTPEVNAITVAAWRVKAEKTRKSTLVFCVDVDHIKGLTAAFQARGIDARYVTGTTKQADRFTILNAFKNIEFPVLVNCGVFTEGTDIPNIDCIILARPTRSRTLLIQMIGRGMRLCPDKKDCHIIDMVSTLETGIVTTPTLFGMDPAEVFEEADLHKVEEIKDKASRPGYVAPSKSVKARFSGASGLDMTEYDSVLDLIRDDLDDKPIRALSRNSWVGVGNNRYILGGPTGSFLRIERVDGVGDVLPEFASLSDLDDFEAWSPSEPQIIERLSKDEENPLPQYIVSLIRALPPKKLAQKNKKKAPFAKPRLLLAHPDFASAVRGADMYSAKIFPQVFTNLRAVWRRLPATEGQLKMLNKMRPKEKQLDAGMVTKGHASDMITKLKHGAKNRFAKHVKNKARKASVMNKALKHHEDQRKMMEVKVGPVNAS